MKAKRTPVGIAEGVYWLSFGPVSGNVYFVRSGMNWALIDTSVAGSAGAIKRAADELCGHDNPPAAILLTHVHPDHAGAAPELARAWSCPVYVPETELPLATAHDLATLERFAIPLDRWIVLPIMRRLSQEKVSAILAAQSMADCARPLNPGDAPGLDGWTAVATPGHTPGHLAFRRERDGVLIAGDAVLTVNAGSFIGMLAALLRPDRVWLAPPARFTNRNHHLALTTITILAELEPRVLATGHGPPLIGQSTAERLRRCARRAVL